MSEQTFHEYPKAMVHPHYRKAASTPVLGSGRIDPVTGRESRPDMQGTPERFPPVLVNNQEQEEMHAAQGYTPAGTMDAKAFARGVAAPVPASYQPAEYPKWVVGVLVNTAEEEALMVAPASSDAPAPAGGQVGALNRAHTEALQRDPAEDEATTGDRASAATGIAPAMLKQMIADAAKQYADAYKAENDSLRAELEALRAVAKAPEKAPRAPRAAPATTKPRARKRRPAAS